MTTTNSNKARLLGVGKVPGPGHTISHLTLKKPPWESINML